MSLKSILIGSPIETVREKHERLPKTLGLAVFASDALSSVAYATEEILLVLVLAGTTMLHYSMPIAIGIAALIAIVAISYRQTIHAYPSGGGSYIGAKDNLGINAGLVAAAGAIDRLRAYRRCQYHCRSGGDNFSSSSSSKPCSPTEHDFAASSDCRQFEGRQGVRQDICAADICIYREYIRTDNLRAF
jgi:hypothetical protein